MADLLHGTGIAVGGRAVLVRGRSGAGKSDLALRCLALSPGPLVPFQPILVADDQVEIARVGEHIVVSPPLNLAGLIEVRGVGIVRVPHAAQAVLALVADLVTPDEIQRLPDPLDPFQHQGIAVPRIAVTAFEASSAIKLVVALCASRVESVAP